MYTNIVHTSKYTFTTPTYIRVLAPIGHKKYLLE